MAERRQHIRGNRSKRAIAERRDRIRRALGAAAAVIGLLIAAPAMAVVCIFGHDVLTQASYFDARAIAIVGNHRLTRERVLARAGLNGHDNILGVNLDLVRQRLLADPWIAAADVDRRLPDRIDIRVREQVPMAVLRIENRRFLINTDGRIFIEVGTGDEPNGLPEVTGLGYADLDFDAGPSNDPYGSMVQVLKLNAAGKLLPPGLTLKGLAVDREAGITLILDGTVARIRLGYGQWDQKIRNLDRVWRYLQRPMASGPVPMVDLINLNRVVVTPPKPEASPNGSQKEG